MDLYNYDYPLNRMIAQNKNFISRWPLLAGMLWLAFVCTASSALPSYINNAITSYTVPPQVVPIIDATNFINNSSFNINFTATAQGQNIELYETDDTLNYTNNGLMTANSSFLLDNSSFILSENLGCGFQFDDYSIDSGFHNMAGTFYNPGTIRANSFQDLGTNFIFVLGVGKCLVNASNIISPGTIDLGFDSLMQLNGQNVDLTRGTLTEEDLSTLFSDFAIGNAGLNGIDFGVGTDTNGDWDPSAALQPTFAISSEFTSQLFFLNQMLVDPSTPYFSTAGSAGTNYNLVRAVFINNPGTNVTASIYFGGNPFPNLGPGFVTVGWSGSFVDPITGQPATNYLYLNDLYVRGANTNNVAINGVPANFTFTELTTPAIFTVAPAAPAYPFIVPGIVTNNYSYVDAQLTASSEATNASQVNPNGALSNFVGRIQVNATHSLDLSLSKMSGMNFLSLTSTNQFNGAAGAQIFSPFSDVNLGVTNGTLVFSNVLEPDVPSWGGTCQAWSSDWITMTTNFSISIDTNNVATTNIYAVTNEYRVMLINANLTPTTPSQVQHLLLHATNDLVICDTLNVFGKFSIDAQNLTLTPSDGDPTSTDGELNLQGSTNFWQTSAPNLRNVTNNGAIRLNNFQQFGSSAPFSITNTTIVPGATAMTATGLLSAVSLTNVALNDSVTIGTNKYVFVFTISKRGVGNEVKIASSIDSSLQNLIAAVNHGPGVGTIYSLRTVTNRLVFALPLANHSFAVIAATSGAAANSIATTTTSKRLTWNGHGALVGGITGSAGSTNSVVTTTGGRYQTFINNGILSDQGASMWADNFVNSGTVSSDVGSFTLFSLTATMTNDVTNVVFTAGGDVAITADTLVISNTFLTAGRSLTLTATNLLTDGGPASANIWVVGNNSLGNGLSLLIKPPIGDLLGTTITNYAPAGRDVVNIWSANDVGVSVAGFTNNEAIGRLILDALGTAPATRFTFNGTGNSNALYVDDLQLLDSATNTDGGGNFPSLNIATNMVIYYAQAEMNGLSIAQKMNGKNGDRLRWVPQFIGQFSSVSIIYPDGSTNTFNAALADSTTVDSDGDGTANASDTTPFFTVGEMNVQTYVTNLPPLSMAIQWDSIPSSTNIVTWSTNMTGPFNQTLTNFVSPPTVPPAGGWPITNTVFDPIASPSRFYNVIVIPNSDQFYGP